MNKKHINKSKARRSSKKVKILNSAKNLTSWAGLIPVIKFLINQDFLKMIPEHISHERGCNAKYDLADALFLTIIGIMGGAKSISSVLIIWSDKILQRIGGWTSIPDESNLGRIFRSLSWSHVSGMEKLNHEMRKKIWKKAASKETSFFFKDSIITVDTDSTEKTAYGKQEGVEKGYNPHKRGRHSYHPLLAFCAETKEILQGWQRCGSSYTSNGVEEFMKQLLEELKGHRIFFRADSGFFRGKLFDLLDSLNHKYLVKVKLKNLPQLLAKQEWKKIEKHPGWEECEFLHKCSTWNTKRKFVGLRCKKTIKESNQKTLFNDIPTYDYFCYVTTESLSAWDTHKKYGERATCETWIEEAKNQMALSHIKSKKFWSSGALFQCSVIAYNTTRWMSLLSKNKTMKKWEPETIRTFLIRVAGHLVTGSNQLRLKTPEVHLYRKQWDLWVDIGLNA